MLSRGIVTPTPMRRRVGFGLFAILLIAGSLVGADEPPSLAKVRDAYREVPDRLRNLAVEYRLTGQPLADPKVIKEFDLVNYENAIEGKFACRGEKIYSEQKYLRYYGPGQERGGPKAPTRRMIAAFNGRETRIYEEKGSPEIKGNANLEIFAGNEVGAGALDIYLGYLGFPRLDPSFFFLDDLKKGPWSTKLRDVLDDPACQVEATLKPCADGTDCVLVAAKGQRLWLDPRLGLALRQREWAGPGTRGVITRLVYGDHAEAAPRLWLARSINRECYADPERYPKLAGKPYRTESIKVSLLSTEPVPDDRFAFQSPPGTLIVDASKVAVQPGEKYQRVLLYRVPAAPLSLDAAAARAMQEAQEALTKGSPTAAWSRGFLIANLLAIVAVIGYGIIQMRQREASRSTGEAAGGS